MPPSHGTEIPAPMPPPIPPPDGDTFTGIILAFAYLLSIWLNRPK